MSSQGSQQDIHRFRKLHKELTQTLSWGREVKRKLEEIHEEESPSSPTVNLVEKEATYAKKMKSPEPAKAISAPLSPVSQELIRIGVIIRGDITIRIFNAWSANLPKRLSSCKFSFLTSYTSDLSLSFVVADAKLPEDQIWRWCGDSVLNAPIVSSTYLVEAIKAASLPPFAEYLHPSQSKASISVTESKVKTPSQSPSSLPDPIVSLIPPPSSSTSSLKPYDKVQYACILTGNMEKSTNGNKFVTDLLEELQKIYELVHDEWRSQGYKKCIAIIKQMPRITSISQLENVKGIGSSMREKIHEILSTGSLKKLSFFKNDPKIQALTTLSQIWGVGEKTASQLIKQGFTTIQQLREKGQHILTTQQKIGLKYYEELLEKIPREEMTYIESIVQTAAKEVFGPVECLACGSYRRGKPSSGDIDILIAPTSAMGVDSLSSNSLSLLIEKLSEIGLLTDHLALPTPIISNSSFKEHDEIVRLSYMGVCKPYATGMHRRIDIKIYPRSMFALAMLYFTGSDHFNRSMRLYAKKRGFHLSDKHLIYQEKVSYFARQFPYTVGQSFACDTEEDVFKILLLPFKGPTERNVFDVDHLLTEEEKEEYKAVPIQQDRFFFRHEDES